MKHKRAAIVITIVILLGGFLYGYYFPLEIRTDDTFSSEGFVPLEEKNEFTVRLGSSGPYQNVKASYNKEEKTIDLEFSSLNKIHLPSQSVPYISVSYRVDSLDMGRGSPPSFILRLSGGYECTVSENHVFSLVDGAIKSTFHFSSYQDHYFNIGNCSYLGFKGNDRFYFEEGKDQKVDEGFPEGEVPFTLTRFDLIWDTNEKVFQKRNPTSIPITFRPIDPFLLYSQEFKKLGEVKGKTLNPSGYKICSDEDGIECNTEPTEKERWLKVEDKEGKVTWVLFPPFEAGRYDTNSHCSF